MLARTTGAMIPGLAIPKKAPHREAVSFSAAKQVKQKTLLFQSDATQVLLNTVLMIHGSFLVTGWVCAACTTKGTLKSGRWLSPQAVARTMNIVEQLPHPGH